MWFIPRTKFEVEPHSAAIPGAALSCKLNSHQAVCIPLKPDGATFDDGFALHFSKGNTTGSNRRGLILNFRPKAMTELERSQGIDHQGGKKSQ